MSHKYNRSYPERRDSGRSRNDRYDDRHPSPMREPAPYGYGGYPPPEPDRGYPPPPIDPRAPRWSPERSHHRDEYRDGSALSYYDRRPDRIDSRYPERLESSRGYPQRNYESHPGRHDYRDSREQVVDYDRPHRSDPYTDNRSSRRSPPKSGRYQGKTDFPRDDFSRPRQSNDDIIQQSIFLSNLPKDVTVSELASLFGSIGVIQTDKRTGMSKIKLYYNPDGSPKGEGSIYYQDAQAARAAIEWFDKVELRGNHIHVEMADRSYSSRYNERDTRGGRGGRGGYRRGGGAPSRGRDFSRTDRGGAETRGSQKPSFVQPGDWACPSCKNNNFSWRDTCNRCQVAKPADGGASNPQDSYSSNARASPSRGGNPYGAPGGYQY